MTQKANKIIICAVEGKDNVAKKTVQKWFARFKTEKNNMKDEERLGKPPTTDEDIIRTEIDNNPRSTLRQLTGMLNKSKPKK